MSERKEQWWKAEKGKVYDLVLQHVQTIERNQTELFNRFVKLAVVLVSCIHFVHATT